MAAEQTVLGTDRPNAFFLRAADDRSDGVHQWAKLGIEACLAM
jgi:hypothetical protein